MIKQFCGIGIANALKDFPYNDWWIDENSELPSEENMWYWLENCNY